MKTLVFVFFLFTAFAPLKSQTVIRGAKWGDSPDYIKSIERAPLIDESEYESKEIKQIDKTLTYGVDFYGHQAELEYKFVNSKLSSISYIIEIEPLMLQWFKTDFQSIANEYVGKYGSYLNRGNIKFLPIKGSWESVDSSLTVILENYYFEEEYWKNQKVVLQFPDDYSNIQLKLYARPKGKSPAFEFIKSSVYLTISYEPYLLSLPDF